MSLMENKFNPSDIVIVGDSFCANRTKPKYWPNKLVELLSGDGTVVRGKGFSGASWWSARCELIRQLEILPPKVLILCHTEASRIHSPKNFPLNYSTVFAEGEKFLPHTMGQNYRIIQEAGRYYYKFLHCDEWDKWTQTSWYKELEELIEQYTIPYVIHLFCFDDSSSSFKFKHGLTSTETLITLSERQPGGFNHFTEQANISIATAIADMITDHYEDGVVKDFNLLKLCK